jgi:hypothetical protein
MTLRCSRAKHAAQAEATVVCLLVDAVVVAVAEGTLITGRGTNRGRPVKIDRIVGVKVTTLMRHQAAAGIVVGGTRINSLQHPHGNPHRLDIRASALVHHLRRLPLGLTCMEVLLTATVMDSNMRKAKGMASTGRRRIHLHQAAIQDSSIIARLLGRTAAMVMAPTTMTGDVEAIRAPGTTGSREDLVASSRVCYVLLRSYSCCHVRNEAPVVLI